MKIFFWVIFFIDKQKNFFKDFIVSNKMLFQLKLLILYSVYKINEKIRR